ncbi:hypothetical protein MMC10_010147 [Thelotrema lepadinum]|nr:hypothetical protein [Thelotrema lepadinum]
MAREKPFSKVSRPSVQQNSPLLELPADVRSTIYKLVLTDRTVEIPQRRKLYPFGCLLPDALVMTCKQIHDEAIKEYYACSTFEIKYAAAYRLNQWIKKIGPARASLLKDVRMHQLYMNCDPTFADQDVRANAAVTEKWLEVHKRDSKLPSGVLKGELNFEDGKVWTATPIVLVEEVLAVTVYVT